MSHLKIFNNKDQVIVGMLTSYFPAIMIFITLVLAVLAYDLLFLPQIKRLSEGGDLQIASKQKLLESYTNYYAKLKGLQDDFGQIQADKNYDKMTYALPEKTDLPALLTQIEAIGAANGIQVQKLELSEPKDQSPQSNEKSNREALGLKFPKGVKYVIINLTLGQMDYTGLKTFLIELEKNIRLFDAVTFTFDPRGDTQSLSLLTYYFTNQ